MSTKTTAAGQNIQTPSRCSLMSHVSCLMPHVSRRGQGQDHGQGQGRIRGRGYLGDLCGIAAENL